MRRVVGGPTRSFTLIEVTLGLAILVLIFGVIFQLVQMSVLGADAAAKNSLRSREVSGLFALVRQLCLDLTVRSTVTLVPRAGAAGFDLELANAPLVILPERKDGVRTVRLALEKDPVGGGNSLVLQEIFQATNNLAGQTFPPETNTFLLMREVRAVRWLAGDPRNPDELREWNEPIKPAYLRLELVRRDGQRNLTNTGIFWIPTGYSPSGRPPVDPVTRTPMT